MSQEEYMSSIRVIDSQLNRFRLESEEYNIQLGDWQRRRYGLQNLYSRSEVDNNLINRRIQENEELKKQLKNRCNRLIQMLNNLVVKSTGTVSSLKIYQDGHIREQLNRWKRDQKLSKATDDQLDQLQDTCLNHTKSLLTVRQQTKRIGEYCRQLRRNDEFGQAITNEEQIKSLIADIVQSTFLVDNQPLQVLKVNKIFSASVRLLVGSALNLALNPPKVTVRLINEGQALARHNKQTIGDESSGKIINNVSTMEYVQDKLLLSSNFKKLKLEKVDRAKRKSSAHVVDEKFTLLFQAEVFISQELKINVWAMSVPVVIVVHTHQLADAWATILWDNHFGEADRVPFVVPNQVRFGELADAISAWLEAELKTPGIGLPDEYKKVLANKVFDIPNLQPAISWKKFAKDTLTDRLFTLWEWVYSIARLCHDHLHGMWNDGLIHGFISREETDQLLSECVPGTFIIRFSDSALGGVTIAWVGDDQDQGIGTFSVKPFTSRDLEVRGLADRLSDLTHLLFLYPNRPKDKFFRQYYSPPTKLTNTANKNDQSHCYIATELRTVIPGWSDDGRGVPFAMPDHNQTEHNDNSSGDAVSLDFSPYNVFLNDLDLDDEMDFDIVLDYFQE